MSTLWMLAAQYQAAARWIAESDPDPLLVADTIGRIEADIEDKAEAIAHMIRSLESEARADQLVEQTAAAHAAANTARAKHLRDYLAGTLTALQVEKVRRPGIKIDFRKSSAVIVDDADALPAEYLRMPPVPEPQPDKIKLAEDIKLGVIVPGAHMEQRKTLRIT